MGYSEPPALFSRGGTLCYLSGYADACYVDAVIVSQARFHLEDQSKHGLYNRYVRGAVVAGPILKSYTELPESSVKNQKSVHTCCMLMMLTNSIPPSFNLPITSVVPLLRPASGEHANQRFDASHQRDLA